MAHDHWGWEANFKALDDSQVLERRNKPPESVKELMFHLQLVTSSMELLRENFVVQRDQVIQQIADNDDLMKLVNGREQRSDNGLEEYVHYFSMAACLSDNFIERVYTICDTLFNRLVTDQAKDVKRSRGEELSAFRSRLSADVASNHPQNYPFKIELVQGAIDDMKKAHINYVKKMIGREADFLRLTLDTTLTKVQSRLYRLSTSYLRIQMIDDQSKSFFPSFPDIAEHCWSVNDILDENLDMDEDANYVPVVTRSEKDEKRKKKSSSTTVAEAEMDVDKPEPEVASQLSEFMAETGITAEVGGVEDMALNESAS